jgi:hypothetical protein
MRFPSRRVGVAVRPRRRIPEKGQQIAEVIAMTHLFVPIVELAAFAEHVLNLFDVSI